MYDFLKKYNISLIRFMLLLPIILVAIISISHVVLWYNLSNPFIWSIYLSVAIEIAAMVAIIATSLKIKGGSWGIFIIVTLIQMMGNIFYSYKGIDSNGELFKSWVELTSPIWEILGSGPNDVISTKRWLAFLEGGLLPLISLTCLHFFTQYDDGKNSNSEIVEEKKNEFEEVESIDEEPVTYGEESVESIEFEVLETEYSVEENVVNESQDVPDTNVGDITETVENIESISESQQRIIDNANLSNLEYIRKMVGIPEPIVQTPEPEIEKEIVIEEETNDGEISDNKVRLTYTKNS